MRRKTGRKITLTSEKDLKASVNNNLTSIIVPEIITNKFLSESNTVVNEIIEKIISLVISTNFNNNVEKKISSSCFNYIKETMDSFLSSAFIPHDKDETYQDSFMQEKTELIPGIEAISKKNELSNMDIDNINNNSHTNTNLKLEEQYYYNNFYHGENDWDLMDEPKSNHYDRYATTLIKMKEIEKEKNLKYQKNGEVLEEIDEESEKNSINKDKRDSNMKRTQIQRITNKIINNKKPNISNNSNNNRTKKKNLYDIMNQFSFHDLDDNDDIYVEPNDISIEKLRKEEQEKQKIENEEKKDINKAKIEIENKLREEAEKHRKYAGKKITVDANGEIVVIRGIKLDKLSREFISLKTGTKLIRDEEKERKKKKKKKNQDDSIQDDKNMENNKEGTKKEEVEKNKISDNQSQKGFQKIKGSKLLPKIKNKLKGPQKENNEDVVLSKLLKRIEEGPIIPSGSNFDIMNMEVGVSLKENEKYKTGGKDFYHKYNKYSMANYNAQLKETTEVNSFLKTHAEVENPMTKSDINYLGNLTDTYNSTGGFISHSNINKMNKNYMLSNFNTLSNFGLKGNLSLYKTKDLNSSLNPKMKVAGNTSLLGSMEKLNLISERQEKLAKKSENLFKKNISNFSNYSSAKEIVLPKLEEINKFTSEILTSDNWMTKNGINNTIGAPFRNPGKPGYRQISMEMGIRGKILRNRIRNASQVQVVPPALEAFEFFKK